MYYKINVTCIVSVTWDQWSTEHLTFLLTGDNRVIITERIDNVALNSKIKILLLII